MFGKTVAKLQPLGDAPPKIDAYAVKGSVIELYHKGRRILDGDDQLLPGRGRGQNLLDSSRRNLLDGGRGRTFGLCVAGALRKDNRQKHSSRKRPHRPRSRSHPQPLPVIMQPSHKTRLAIWIGKINPGPDGIPRKRTR